MRILFGYVLREHIGPFFLGLLLFTFVLVMNRVFELVDLIIGKGLRVMTVLEVFFLSLPFILALTIPMAVLVAVLVAFGRLSQDSEITALKASGVNLYSITVSPFLAFSIVAIGLVYFNNHVLPESNHRVKNLMIDISRKKPGIRFQEGVFNPSIEGFNILVKSIDHRTSKLRDVVIYERKRGEQPRTIIAKEGEFVTSSNGPTILRLYQGEIHELDEKEPEKYRKLSFERHELTLPAESELERKERAHRGDRELSASAMLERVRKIRTDIATAEGRIKDLKVEADIERELRNIEHNRKRISRYMVEVHKKYAIPFACLVFVLVGFPLGTMVRRGGLGVGSGISILVFVFYYLFLVGGENLADRRVVPPWIGMWSANIMLLILGGYLIHHVCKGTPFRFSEKVRSFFYRRRG